MKQFVFQSLGFRFKKMIIRTEQVKVHYNPGCNRKKTGKKKNRGKISKWRNTVFSSLLSALVLKHSALALNNYPSELQIESNLSLILFSLSEFLKQTFKGSKLNQVTQTDSQQY